MLEFDCKNPVNGADAESCDHDAVYSVILAFSFKQMDTCELVQVVSPELHCYTSSQSGGLFELKKFPSSPSIVHIKYEEYVQSKER